MKKVKRELNLYSPEKKTKFLMSFEKVVKTHRKDILQENSL